MARTLPLLVFTVLSAVPICAHAGDAPPSIEEMVLRAVVIGKCHAVLTDDDKAYEEVVSASGQAEMNRIWTQLSAAAPSNVVENARTAKEIFFERIDRAREAAEAKVKDIDCAELERQTKPAAH